MYILIYLPRYSNCTLGIMHPLQYTVGERQYLFDFFYSILQCEAGIEHKLRVHPTFSKIQE